MGSAQPNRTGMRPLEDVAGLPAAGEPEQVDALPVLVEAPPVSDARSLAGVLSNSVPPQLVPAVQAAAAAAGGFLAGAAIIGVVNRRHRRASQSVRRPRPARSAGRTARRRTARGGELVQIVGSRSLMVDVHLLGER